MINARTIYNPGVAMVYVIQNTQTGECINASTCGIKDVDFKPWRSPKGTPLGEEFFKMKIGSKKEGISSITFLNSCKYDKCLSTDGIWEFIGKRANGGVIPKLSTLQSKDKNVVTSSIIVIDNRVTSSIDRVKDNNLSLSSNQIHQTIESEEFVDMDEMNKILQ